MIWKLTFKLAIGLFCSLICSKIFAVGENKNPDFIYKSSTYPCRYFRKILNNKGNFETCVPVMSNADEMAFIVVKITIQKESVSCSTSEEKYFSEISTGFLAWSTYELKKPIQAISGYYIRNSKKEPLLITCKHCVKEWEDTEIINELKFNIHYVDSKDGTLYLVTVKLSNKTYKQPWVLGDRDIAALRLGTILQKGKEKLDKELKSDFYPLLFGAVDPINAISMENNSIGYLSDVVMYGYPYELSAPNSLPLARFGHCSSDPRQSMWDDKTCGNEDFIVDMASVSGSSGSPMWFYCRNMKGELGRTAVTEGIIENAEVDIEETKCYFFAGMFFKGVEEPGETQIHLGGVINRKTIISFLTSLTETPETNKSQELSPDTGTSGEITNLPNHPSLSTGGSNAKSEEDCQQYVGQDTTSNKEEGEDGLNAQNSFATNMPFVGIEIASGNMLLENIYSDIKNELIDILQSIRDGNSGDMVEKLEGLEELVRNSNLTSEQKEALLGRIEMIRRLLSEHVYVQSLDEKYPIKINNTLSAEQVEMFFGNHIIGDIYRELRYSNSTNNFPNSGKVKPKSASIFDGYSCGSNIAEIKLTGKTLPNFRLEDFNSILTPKPGLFNTNSKSIPNFFS